MSTLFRKKIPFFYAAVIIALIGSYISSSLVFAINTIAEGYRVDYHQSPAPTIDAHNICKIVNNNSTVSKGVFVPTKSNNEWTTFINSSESGYLLAHGVTVSNCSLPSNCYLFEAYGRCAVSQSSWAPVCSAEAVATTQANAWTNISASDRTDGKAAIQYAGSHLPSGPGSWDSNSGITASGWNWVTSKEIEYSNQKNNQGPVYEVSVYKQICY